MKKILIIEDNFDLAENLYLYLKELGYNSAYALNGNNGMRMIMDRKPDIILCDIMLPDITGYKLLSELKKIEERVLPIFIFITAKTQREDLRKGMALGADDYITKPFTKEELLSSIKEQLRKRERIEKSITGPIDLRPSKLITAAEETETNSHLSYNDHLFISDRKNPGFYLIRDIILIKSMRDYTKVYMRDERKYLMRRAMIYWENLLPEKEFFRIHRQTLINLNYVKKVEPLSSNRLSVFMETIPQKLPVSQRFHKKLKSVFQ